VEDTFLQHKNGLLDDSEFDGFRLCMAGLFANTGFCAIWSDLRLFHGRAFREFFDDIERASIVPASTNALERWRESLVLVSHR